MKLQKKAFTLIEIVLSLLIVSLVLITGFQTYTYILSGKVKLIEKTDLQKEAFYFSERLFQLIKEGGTIDYEEYFNRMVVGTGTEKGHYKKNTGFGNFGKGGNPAYILSTNYGDEFYYCRSGNGEDKKMTSSGGCFDNGNFMANGSGASIPLVSNSPQRYGQYSFQFWDYNSNFDDDTGDEDGNGNIVGDDDDENLGEGPTVFADGEALKELYLISGNKKKRTYFRFKRKKDSDAPNTQTCNLDTGGSGCLGTIEFLKLEGKDWGMDHMVGNNDKTENDGVIDTWIVDDNFSGKTNEVAGNLPTDGYRKALFPETVNVSDFKVFLYPNKDQKRAWDIGVENIVSPYLRISFKVEPSWKIKRKITGNIKPVYFNTTINLTDIFSK